MDTNKRDVDKLGEDLGQHMLDFKLFKEIVTKNLLDQGSSLEMEIMLSKIAHLDIGDQLR